MTRVGKLRFPVPSPEVTEGRYLCSACRDTGMVEAVLVTPAGNTYSAARRCQPGCRYLEELTQRALAEAKRTIPSFEERAEAEYDAPQFDEDA